MKKLLVASVGEDIEARVDFLTQDKARLAADVMQYRWVSLWSYFYIVFKCLNPIFHFATSAIEWLLNGKQEMLWG